MNSSVKCYLRLLHKVRFVMLMCLLVNQENVFAFYVNNIDGIPIEYGFVVGGVSVSCVGTRGSLERENITNVRIPSTIDYENNIYNVVNIGSYSFQNMTRLYSLELPNTITTIEQWAFQNCEKLYSLTIPKDVSDIQDNAFWGCKGLASIIVDEDNTNYDSRNNCNAIIRSYDNRLILGCKNTIIPEGVTTLGWYSFANCVGLSSLSSLNFPNSLTTIEDWAFYGCSGLTSITIPPTIISIGAAFGNCNSITSIIVEEGNPVYDSRGNCNALIDKTTKTLVVGCANTTIPDGTLTIGGGSFYQCQNLTAIDIPNSVTAIGNYAFVDCQYLTSMKIPNSVTSIGAAAFDGCCRLTTIQIPCDIPYIFYSTFQDCTNISTVLIPRSVSFIDEGAFYNCSNLTSVAIDIETPLTINYVNYDPFSNRQNATLYVPSGCKAIYESTDYWKDFKEIKEMNAFIVGNEKCRTFSSSDALDFSNVSDITAYIISDYNSNENSLTLSPVTRVQAGEGLLLKGDEGNYFVPCKETDATYTNYLVGVPITTSVSPTDGDYTNFILANSTYGVNFYALSKTGNVSAGKAYLHLPTAEINQLNTSRGFTLINDDATSIKQLNNEYEKDRVFFDLQGRRVNNPSKGLYIINGKKVIIK